MSEASSGGDSKISLPFGRVVLILAGLVALFAVGLAVWKNRSESAPVAASGGESSGMPVGDVTTMVTKLEEKLKQNPADPKGWNMLGWSYYQTGRYADAVKAYRKATELEPANADHWSAMGESLVLSGPGGITPEAKTAFQTALKNDPKDARARYFVAVDKNMAGDHKGAIEDWIALLKDAPADAPWAPPVRDLLVKVAAEEKIDIAGRIPAAPAPQAPTMGSGVAVASEGIPGPTRDEMRQASQLPPGQQDAMVRGMVDGLAAKLKANPKDGDGWIRLMRARMVLGEGREAQQALADARAAFAGNAAELARLGEAAKTLGVPGA